MITVLQLTGELPSSCSDVSEGDPEEVGERKAGRKKTTHKPAQRTRYSLGLQARLMTDPPPPFLLTSSSSPPP